MLIGPLAAIVGLMAAAPGQTQDTTAKLSTRYVKPSVLLSTLRGSDKARTAALPDGVSAIAYDPERFLLVTGPPEGVETVKQTVSLMDVKTKTIRLQMRVCRRELGPNGALQTRVVSAPVVVTPNGSPATITIGHPAEEITIEVLPTAHARGVVALTASMSIGIPTGTHSTTARRRVASGRTVVLMGVGTGVGRGAAGPDMPAGPGYYLEVTARVLK